MRRNVEKVDDSVCYDFDSLFNEDYMNLIESFKDFRPTVINIKDLIFKQKRAFDLCNEYLDNMDFASFLKYFDVFVRLDCTSLSGRTDSSAALPSADPCN